jgi:hypothetical protein
VATGECSYAQLGSASACNSLAQRVLSGAFAGHRLSGDSRQRHIGKCIVHMFDNMVCGALTQWLRHSLQHIADDIEDNNKEWGFFDWHKTCEAAVVNPATSHRRRSDHHAKQFAVRSAIASGEAASCSGAARSMSGVDRRRAYAWKVQEMSCFQAASLFNFDNAESVSVAYDAARLGNPAKEMLAILATNLATGRHAALPPQVLGSWNASGCYSNLLWLLQVRGSRGYDGGGVLKGARLSHQMSKPGFGTTVLKVHRVTYRQNGVVDRQNGSF